MTLPLELTHADLYHSLFFLSLEEPIEEDALIQEKRISLYLKKFEWLSFHWFIGVPPTRAQIKNKLGRLAINAKHELSNIKIEKEKKELREWVL